MSTYSFKKEAKVYVVYEGLQYNIDISDINFSQTFTEESYEAKTLHSQNFFESSVIYKANPANFDFTFPAIREQDFKVVFNRALDVLTFDLYVSTLQDVFKIEKCVITNASFLTSRNRPLGMNIAGEASKLTRVGSFGSYTIPGTVQSRSGSMTYNLAKYMDVLLGGVNIGSEVVTISTELQNNISWLPNAIVTGLCDPVEELIYPTDFIIINKVLGGSITRYITEANSSTVQNWSQDTTLYLEIGQEASGTVYGFKFDLDNCSYTNRAGTTEIFTQSYDWRLTQNPNTLSELISYITLP